MFNIISQSPQKTIQLGQRIAKYCQEGDVICLNGDLGAGKTTFVKGLAKGLKVSSEDVHSPTFVLMNYYQGKLPLYHFDLYRIDGSEGMETVGLDEFFYGNGISVIEWAEKLGKFYPEEYLNVTLKHKGENVRAISVTAHGKKYQDLINRIVKAK